MKPHTLHLPGVLALVGLLASLPNAACVEERNLQLYRAHCYRDAQCPAPMACRDGACVLADAGLPDAADTAPDAPDFDRDVLLHADVPDPRDLNPSSAPAPWRRPRPTP